MSGHSVILTRLRLGKTTRVEFPTLGILFSPPTALLESDSFTIEPRHEKTNWFLNRSETIQAVQAQKMARGWKF